MYSHWQANSPGLYNARASIVDVSEMNMGYITEALRLNNRNQGFFATAVNGKVVMNKKDLVYRQSQFSAALAFRKSIGVSYEISLLQLVTMGDIRHVQTMLVGERFDDLKKLLPIPAAHEYHPQTMDSLYVNAESAHIFLFIIPHALSVLGGPDAILTYLAQIQAHIGKGVALNVGAAQVHADNNACKLEVSLNIITEEIRAVWTNQSPADKMNQECRLKWNTVMQGIIGADILDVVVQIHDEDAQYKEEYGSVLKTYDGKDYKEFDLSVDPNRILNAIARVISHRVGKTLLISKSRENAILARAGGKRKEHDAPLQGAGAQDQLPKRSKHAPTNPGRNATPPTSKDISAIVKRAVVAAIATSGDNRRNNSAPAYKSKYKCKFFSTPQGCRATNCNYSHSKDAPERQRGRSDDNAPHAGNKRTATPPTSGRFQRQPKDSLNAIAQESRGGSRRPHIKLRIKDRERDAEKGSDDEDGDAHNKGSHNSGLRL